MNASTARVPDEFRTDVQTLWDFHDLHHELRRCDVGVGLGSHDLGVADHVVELFEHGWFPRLVFTGANAPMPYARNLEKLKTPTKEKIVDAIKRVCYADGS